MDFEEYLKKYLEELENDRKRRQMYNAIHEALLNILIFAFLIVVIAFCMFVAKWIIGRI